MSLDKYKNSINNDYMLNNKDNTDNLKLEYKLYLESRGCGLSTVKNYLVDLGMFLQFASSFTNTALDKEMLKTFIKNQGFVKFLDSLYSSKVNVSSFNRRISSIRQYVLFLDRQNNLNIRNIYLPASLSEYLNLSQAKNTTSKEILLEQYKLYLQKQKFNQKTINNYESDTSEFLSFLGLA